MNTLALIWGGIIAFGIILYVILDGFDLGIGIAFPFFQNEQDRDIMISTILPVWDGNETWLVFGAAALYGAFPLAFSMILPAIYLPIFIMVIALLFRGAALEFRFKAVKHKIFWDFCIFAGSLVAAFTQGLILGTFIQGFKVSSSLSAAFPLHLWPNFFGIACGIALIFGYLLLGVNHLIIKTIGPLQNKCFKISSTVQYFILFFIIMVSIWSPLLDNAISHRWFNPRNMPFLAILPFLTFIFLGIHYYALKKRYEYLPFWSAIGIFVMCYIGFIISSYPYIVPRQVTYLQAAASHSTLLFMLVGASIMLPPLLFYTYYSYHIFRGKVTKPIGY